MRINRIPPQQRRGHHGGRLLHERLFLRPQRHQRHRPGWGAAPTITSFTPTAGPVGTSVTITGTNLSGATSVKFNGVSVTITSNTATQIVTKVPAGATTGKITVTTAGGTATSATNFTVTSPPHARTISLRLRDSLVARGRSP